MYRKKPFVYLAGPMTVGHPTRLHNVAVATEVFQYLLAHSVYSFVPQWCLLVDATFDPSIHYDSWLALDFEVINRCDALLRIPGESKGADKEVIYATDLGIPVFSKPTWEDGCRELIAYFNQQHT